MDLDLHDGQPALAALSLIAIATAGVVWCHHVCPSESSIQTHNLVLGVLLQR